MRHSGFVLAINRLVDSLVHPAHRSDVVEFARHRSFMMTRILAAALATASLPIVLLMLSLPPIMQILAVSWVLAPLLMVSYLSRSGNYDGAQILSALSIGSIAGAMSWFTGGLVSFAAIWLVLIPVEAALSRSRSVLIWATVIGLGTALILTTGNYFALLPSPVLQQSFIDSFISMSVAAAYAFSLANTYAKMDTSGERKAHAEEARYALLAENMADVITRHSSSGAVTFVSPVVERVFGLSEQDLMNNGLFERVHVADRPAYLRSLSEAMRRRLDETVEFRLRKSSINAYGKDEVAFVWVQMRCRPMQGEGTLEIVSILSDISIRKAQEDAIDVARAEVDRAHQAKGRFLANVSHELRTPLNAILGFSEMLQHEQDLNLDGERRKEYASLIHESGGHLLNLVNSILDMSKLETGNFQITPEPFDLLPLAENARQMLQLKAEEAGSRIELDIPDTLPELNADKRACRQILLNLLSNAVKFTGKDGVIMLGARNDGHHIALFVADTGTGIGEDDLQYIGTPFFQAKSTYDKQHQGTGLGLSVVRGLVELHGGRMEIISRLGEGTRVTVHLPSAGALVTPIHNDKLDDAAEQAFMAEKLTA